MFKRSLLFIALLSLFLITLVPTLAQDTGRTLDTLNVRGGSGTNFPIVTQININTDIVVEARNDATDWLLIRTPDGAIRGWVATRFIEFSQPVNLNVIPVNDEIIGVAPEEVAQVPAESAQLAETPGAPAPEPQQTVAEGEYPAGVTNGTLISQMNVRLGPGTEYDSIGQLNSGERVSVEGRNRAGDWVMINIVDRVRGWVYSPYVNMGETDVFTLPVINEVVGLGRRDAEEPAIVLPDRDIPAMTSRLQNIPVLHNMLSNNVYQIYWRGQEFGNNPRVFMKVGDSVTAEQPFMTGFGNGNYNLGGYQYLQNTIDHFSVSPRAGIENSFVNPSIAAQSGFTSSAIFDGLWVNPGVCTEAALYCEYNLTKPSVAIIMLGSVDLRSGDPFVFQGNIYKVVRDLAGRGVIPVLTTFPNHPEILGEDAIYYNNIVLNAAQDFNTPVINLWAATQRLPDAGINLADPIHMTQGADYFNFEAGQEDQYGVSLRNLLTLQALEQIRANVLAR